MSRRGLHSLVEADAGDPTKMPPDRQPGLAGVYSADAAGSTANATTISDLLADAERDAELLAARRSSGAITGSAQTAPLPPTVQEIATARRSARKRSRARTACRG
jgi:hypothetical protein